jgi:hypothetical protein
MLAEFLGQPEEQHSHYPDDICAYLNSVPSEAASQASRKEQMLAQVRHGMVEKVAKPCRISSGNSWVYTTFAIELEALR